MSPHYQISDFLADYAEHCRDRGEQPLPDAVLRPILEDFVLTELWQDPDPTVLSVAISSLRRIVAKDGVASQILSVIEREAAALHGRLERQRNANAVLQEHVVNLAGALARHEG